MNRKRLIVIVVALVFVAVAGYFVIDGINQANAKRERYLFGSYQIQNEAFFGLGQGEYMPYDATREPELQIHINVYTRKTGKTITLKDVETFLTDEKNSDGSPRTWEDDTSVIFEFVNWCADNALAMFDYRNKLEGELTKYYHQHPDSQYITLSDLNVDQINELDKKLNDPNYELDLENLK